MPAPPRSTSPPDPRPRTPRDPPRGRGPASSPRRRSGGGGGLARRRRIPLRTWTAPGAWLLAAGAVACGDPAGPGSDCSLPQAALVDGGPRRDSIPALADPILVDGFDAAALYVDLDDRVIGLRVDGVPVAVPHSILWWHEVVDFDFPGREVTVSYSPFTGSSLVFDRSSAGVARFAVSDFLFNANLVMEDGETGSLWPQMSRAARCGVRDGTGLPVVPSVEMSWRAWRGIHRDTRVVSRATGFERPYTLYPYGDYEDPDNPELPQAVGALDPRRAPKERVVGIPDGRGGIAFPFPELAGAAAGHGVAVARARVGGQPVVVLWSDFARSAIAFRPRAGGADLELEVREGAVRDLQTGSRWRFDGLATAGPLTGARLEPHPGAFVSFWFAWALFQPDTEVWAPGE